jgi:Rap1a immunity proteins
LLKSCQDAEQFDERKPVRNPFGIGMCFGLLEGVYGAMQSLNPGLPASLQTCFPEKELATIQAVRIVLKFLRENPEQHHEAADHLVALAYRRAYPCKQ